MQLDLDRTLREEFPVESRAAVQATDLVLAAIAGRDLSAMARRSPGLTNYDWTAYLRCSELRVVRVLRALGTARRRVLDYGSYFGNASLACAFAGHNVTAVDSYTTYGNALADCRARMAAADISVVDFEDCGADLGQIPAESFDAVLCLGVLEHIPHTPRRMLESIDRVLHPGGLLLLDTPNLAYLYTRERLSAGNSIFTPIEQQYHTELPFEGHHREYTAAEVTWMLKQLGHEIVHTDLYSYSIYAARRLYGADAERYEQMASDPNQRELIFVCSRKGGGA